MKSGPPEDVPRKMPILIASSAAAAGCARAMATASKDEMRRNRFIRSAFVVPSPLGERVRVRGRRMGNADYVRASAPPHPDPLPEGEREKKRRLHPGGAPSRSQPNFSRALRATSAEGALVGGNWSRQWNGLHASMTATECVMSPLARFSGDKRGSAGESHE